jgi:hypothetical protein
MKEYKIRNKSNKTCKIQFNKWLTKYNKKIEVLHKKKQKHKQL